MEMDIRRENIQVIEYFFYFFEVIESFNFMAKHYIMTYIDRSGEHWVLLLRGKLWIIIFELTQI